MPMSKPTLDMLIKVHVGKQSASRVAWNKDKQIASKYVNIKVFKDALGPKLDALNALYLHAIDTQKKKPANAKQLLREALAEMERQQAELEQVTGTYKKICRREEAAATSQAAKDAWSTLEINVEGARSRVAPAVNKVRAWAK